MVKYYIIELDQELLITRMIRLYGLAKSLDEKEAGKTEVTENESTLKLRTKIVSHGNLEEVIDCVN